MDVTIRQAVTEDLDVLRLFEQGVIDAERRYDPTIKDEPVQYYDLKAMIAAQDVHFVVAEYDAQVIGCGYARIQRSKHFLRHPVHGYLGLMYVDPRHRGRAVIARIIEVLQAWCLSWKIAELRLEVYRDNRGAIRAYQKFGFSEHVVEMRLGIGKE